uniref:Myelin protein P0 n=1 Tax=Xenopus tropicalis TaxID=8364 RepID=A0A803JJM7_XENTR
QQSSWLCRTSTEGAGHGGRQGPLLLSSWSVYKTGNYGERSRESVSYWEEWRPLLCDCTKPPHRRARVHFSTSADVSPAEDLFIENGTQALLPCNFKSLETTGTEQSVTWTFRPDSGSNFVTIFVYSNGNSYPGNAGQFKDRISWAGELTRKDASIKVDNMQFRDNGTYTCIVVNLPDLGSLYKQIQLRVVEKGEQKNLPLSNGPLLIGIICAVISALLIIASIIFAVCIYKKKKSRKDYTG